MSTLWSDVRLALRACARRPGFTAVVLLTLGLGVGANTTIFSLIYGTLLRPFPYTEPERLVRVHTEVARVAGNIREASVFDFQDWRAQNRSFEDLAAYWSFVNTLSGSGTGAAQSVLMTFATPQLFSVLGVTPALGRVFTPEEDRIGGPVNQAVLGFGLWQSRFGGRPDVIGQTIRLRGDTFTVIGVMPAGFRFPERTDVWVPLMSRYASYPTPWWQDRNVRIHSVIGRLRADATITRAQADLDAIGAQLARDFPSTNTETRIRLVSLRDAEVGTIRPYLVVLLVAVAMVLLIACVNIANLLLVRAMARESEMALRTALGATRGRLIRQALTESAVLAILGSIVGVALAYGGVHVLLGLIPIELPFWMRIDVNGWVLAFSAAMSLITGLTVGLAPALYASRHDLTPSFKDSARGSVGPARQRARQALVVAEVALSLPLIVGAALMMQSFRYLEHVDTGFESHGLLSAYVGHFLPNRSYQEMTQIHAVDFRRILDRLRELPGVVSVGGATAIPYYERPDSRGLTAVSIPGQNDQAQRSNLAVATAEITPGYLSTMGIPLFDGRDFTDADDWTAPLVALVSQRLADRLWPGNSAIGQSIRFGDEGPLNPWHRVIGVVGDTRWHATERQAGGEAYFSYRQWPAPKLHLLVRTDGDPLRIVPELRRIAHDVNPENAVTYIRPLDDIVGDALWRERLWASVLGAFGGLALVLVTVGIYGVMSHSVGQRTREIGIRVALGAERRDLRTLILGQGFAMVLTGLALGIGAALALSGVLGHLVYGVSATDPWILGGVSGILCLAALLACAIPLRKAMRVDPTVALRAD